MPLRLKHFLYNYIGRFFLYLKDDILAYLVTIIVKPGPGKKMIPVALYLPEIRLRSYCINGV